MMINHIMCISKILSDLCFTKQKIKAKNGFVEVVYSVLVVNVLIKHKENCLSINGKQSIKLEKGITEFENCFKQTVPFKIYADFECNLRGAEYYGGSYTKNIKITFLLVSLIKLFVLMIGLLSEFLFIEVKMQLMNWSKQFLQRISIAKK